MPPTSGSSIRAKLSRVERPTESAFRLCSTLSPCFLMWRARSASTADRSSTSRSPRPTRWSAKVRALSRVQAWNAATSWPWLIRPFCNAIRPKSRLRSAAIAVIDDSPERREGAGGARSAVSAALGLASTRIDRIIA